MFEFLKRKRVMKYLQNLQSSHLEDYFQNFLTSVKFEKNKILMLFKISGKGKKEAANFEKEITNIAQVAGFKKKDISIIISEEKENITSTSKEPEKKKHLQNIKHILCIASCKGGVGKSTIAINVAKDYAEKGFKVGILDADIYGPSIPIMLGIEGEKMKIIDGKITPIEREGIKITSMGFLIRNDEALMWRGSMVTKTISQLIEGTNWGELDVLVVDLPPGTGDIYLSLLSSYKISGVLMVSSPHTISLEELKKTITLFKKFDIKILGVVENMIENESNANSEFKFPKKEFKKDGFIRTNLNFADKIIL